MSRPPGGGRRQDTLAARTARKRSTSEAAHLSPCLGVLLPLAITGDRSRDAGTAGTPDPSVVAHFALRSFNTALPRDFPALSRPASRSHTRVMSPVAGISRLSHLLIALKLQFMWIASDGPEKTPAPSGGLAAGE